MKIKPGESVCFDTNILLDATDEGRKNHELATEVFRSLPSAGITIQLATQVLREYVVVATRSVEKNGLGLSLEDATDNVEQFCRCGTVISESAESFGKMLQWALKTKVLGNKLHDLQILATASERGADIFLTSNVADFPPDFGPRILSLGDLRLV